MDNATLKKGKAKFTLIIESDNLEDIVSHFTGYDRWKASQPVTPIESDDLGFEPIEDDEIDINEPYQITENIPDVSVEELQTLCRQVKARNGSAAPVKALMQKFKISSVTDPMDKKTMWDFKKDLEEMLNA